MPNTEKNTQIFDYPMAKRGVNLYSSILELNPEECNEAQNVIWRNGIVKRGGQKKLSTNTTEVKSGKKIVGLHRFYKQDGSTKQLLVASGTDISYDNSGSWANISTSQTEDLETHMKTWGVLNKVFIANGTNFPIQWDGSTAIDGATTTIVILDATDLNTNDTVVTITVDGTITALTEGADWTATNGDNSATATSLASAIDGVSGVSASASTATITVTADAGTGAIESLISDESDATNITIAHIAIPRKALQFLPYQDRLLCIDTNRPGDLTWSKSFDVTAWETLGNVGVRPDSKLYGMLLHSLTNVNAGYVAAVLLAGSSDMYLFQGTKLDPTSSPNYTIYPLALDIGCNAPKTMVWTPAGSMWLGVDRQIYLLPFNSSTPIPVSDKIRSNRLDIEGIESIPAAQIQNACAKYHKGFYILSVTKKGETVNSNQWWLDVNRLQQNENRLWEPWYGPITGQNINVFETQSGAGDSGELIGGEAQASTGSFVYELNDVGVNDDSGNAVLVRYKSYYHNLGNPYFMKDVLRGEVALLNTSGTVEIEFHDTTKVFNESLWSCDTTTGKIYNTSINGILLSSFTLSDLDAAATSPTGVALGLDGSLWVCDSAANKIYNIPVTGDSITSSFLTTAVAASANTPTGITVDSNGSLWFVDFNTDTIYNVQTDGTSINSFTTSTFDILWVVDATADKIYNIQTDGTLISSFATSVFDVSATFSSGIAVASDGNLWVCDSVTDKIYNIQTDGTLISSFATSVYDGSATIPTGIAVASDGNLWVVDATTDKIYNIQTDGTLISSFATSVYDGSATIPTGIAVASDGNLWVVDTNTDKIYNIQTDGTLISSFATSVYDGSASDPRGIAVASDGNLWVMDATTDKIYNIQTDGTLISSFATSVFDVSATFPRGTGIIKNIAPSGITIAADRSLWYIDSDSQHITHMTNTGAYLNSFSTAEFDILAINPTGISIAGNGTLWITDSTADKYYNVTTTGTLISSFATSVFDSDAITPSGIGVTTKVGSAFDLSATSVPVRQPLEISTTQINPRRLALVARHNSSDAKFELYRMAIEAKERSLSFE